MSYLEHYLVKGLINKSKIMEHFITECKIYDNNENFSNETVLKCFFLVWFSINGIKIKTLKNILENVYSKNMSNDILKRIIAYKIFYVNYEEKDEKRELNTERGTITVKRSHEMYQIYLDHENWCDIIHIYESVKNFWEFLNDPDFYLKLKDLSNLFMSKGKKRDENISKENYHIKLKEDLNIKSNYYLLLLFKCFIIQVYNWDKIFDEMAFLYDKDNLDKSMDSYFEYGFLNEEIILELINNIKIV